jgi:hypothetical protein
MTRERWQQIETVFQAALACDGENFNEGRSLLVEKHNSYSARARATRL